MTVRAAYQDRLASGKIAPDPAQARAVEALSRLEEELNALSEPGFSLPFMRSRKPPPRGLYLYGPVGRGKSMVMDLFFEEAPAAKRKRVHFHAFMARVHGLIDQWRKGDAAQRKAVFGQSKGDDPILPTAELIADETRLLCFDEFVVTDIADAMILGRLFEALFARGVVVVATSNRHPDELYRNGVNRQLFLPFIALLKEKMEVIEVGGPKDFRLARLKGARVYFTPLDDAAETGFEALWRDLLDGQEETGAVLEVLGRKMRLPRAAGGMLRSSFASLCGQALGPQDYLAVAGEFHTLFLEAVPLLTPDRRNEAARFVSLIDALYEARVKLITLAEAEPEALYPAGDGAFEFERTVSRLQEMRSKSWVEMER
jgi:cell division protein ZapE